MTKKKLIEVALPLEAINRESAREKSIRHGHPSTLHLWWARRPLAACRAVLFAQLVDDPSAHPEEFPTEADQEVERKRLFDLIERLVVWESANDEALLAEAHAEILKSTDGNPPPILDPFAGGGSIPLEAQRLGLEAHASDLNPVAVLINKALIEIPPKWAGRPPVFPGAASGALGDWPRASGLAEDVRRYGQWMRDEAVKRIGHLYPKATLPNGSSAEIVAWIWARTATCPNPGCGLEMPLVRTFWLGKKRGKEAFLVPKVADGGVRFLIGGKGDTPPGKQTDGTMTRAGAICLKCGTAAPFAYLREQGRRGLLGVQLLSTVVLGDRRRIYLPAQAEQEECAAVAAVDGLAELELADNVWDIKVKNYGLVFQSDLFTPRQQRLLIELSSLVNEARAEIATSAVSNAGMTLAQAEEYARDVSVYLACGVSRLADYGSSLVTWSSHAKMEALRNTFSRQALSMAWDFAEGNPWSSSTGNWTDTVRIVASVVERLPATKAGYVCQEDAVMTKSTSPLAICTDPPYYDNVGYANLSDFFYGWLRVSMATAFPDLFGTVATPKSEELVADPYRHDGRSAAQDHFRIGFERTFRGLLEASQVNVPMTVFYAFKQSESHEGQVVRTGWETLLEGMITSGWVVTATWPIRTEYASRVRAGGTNSLASSIVLACRPRNARSEAVNRRQFINALKAELPLALRNMQQGSVAPVDLAQATIGPGMAVFSRHSRVVEADGSDMTVRTALALINQVLDEVLEEQEGDFDADTRFCVKWFSQFGWNESASGEADVLARATNTAMDGLVRGGVFRAVAGKARLLTPEELSTTWDPLTDERVSVWEVVVRLAHALTEVGVDGAAPLFVAAGQRVDLDTAQELAYLLYALCEKKGWTESARLFNALGSSWSDVTTASRSLPRFEGTQSAFDFSDEGSEA